MAIIGILGTPYNTVEQSPFWWNKVSYTRQSFIDVFQDLGHTVIILPVDKIENIKNYLTLVDKIVLTGGADVSPYLYGEEPNAKLGTTDPIRDRFELATIKAALEANKPILGICRGLQLLNVYFGGSLYQDLSQTSSPVSYTHLRAHETDSYLVCRLLLEKKKKNQKEKKKKKKCRILLEKKS